MKVAAIAFASLSCLTQAQTLHQGGHGGRGGSILLGQEDFSSVSPVSSVVESLTYSKDIAPLIADRCAMCHTPVDRRRSRSARTRT